MKMIKPMLLAAIVIVAVLTAVGCSSGDKPDASEPLRPNDVVRTDNQKAVTVKVALINPIADVGPELTFELNLDTHSVDLSTYDLLSNLSISTESGINLTGDDLLWENISDDSHHRTGLLIVPQELLKLGSDLGEVRLELYDLSGVPLREFVWEQEFLFNMN